MNKLLRLTFSTAILLNFTSANAGLFDLFKTKDPHYQQDVAACWSAVSASISEKNRNMNDFRIEHDGPNSNTGRRAVMFFHSQSGNTRGCIFESNGTIHRIIGLRS